jgi:hypothetical protein
VHEGTATMDWMEQERYSHQYYRYARPRRFYGGSGAFAARA